MSDASNQKRDALARQIAEHMLSSEGTGPAWGITILAAHEGYAKISMRVTAAMLNGHGTAHGGMIFALADTAFAYACNSRNETAVAQSATIVFLAPAREGDVLIAEAEERGTSGRSGAYAVRVRTEDGRTIADFQGASRTLGGAILP